MNSRDKGKRGELELAHFLSQYGYDTRRGQQYAGANGDADVVGVPGMHVECKRTNTVRLREWREQATRDARPGEIPVIFHRRDRGEWLVILSAEHFMEVWKALDEFLTEREGNE